MFFIKYLKKKKHWGFASGPVETSAQPSLKVGPGERGNVRD